MLTQGHCAFSLVEIVVAISIVGTGIVAVLTTVASLSGGAAYTADSVAAAALAQSMMAEIDTRPFHGTTPTPTGRIVENIVAYYPFEDGAGSSASDGSRLTPLAPLSFVNEPFVQWIPGTNGVSIQSGGALENINESSKIIQPCMEAGQITVEVWFEPASVASGESPIVNCAPGTVNFILSQRGADLLFYVRTTSTDGSGNPPAATLAAPLTKDVTHCVATFDGTCARIFVNGMPFAVNELAAGDLTPWVACPFRMAKHPSWGKPWAGKLFLAAIYSTALKTEEIQANFAAGPSPGRLYNRSGYDDIDDYNGYADSPPRAENGSAIAGAEQFSRTVEVVTVAPADLDTEKAWDSTDAKRITVNVYKHYKLLATLVRARYRGVSTYDVD